MGPGAHNITDLRLDAASLRALAVGTRLYLSLSTMPNFEHDSGSDCSYGALCTYTTAVIAIACQLSSRVG